MRVISKNFEKEAYTSRFSVEPDEEGMRLDQITGTFLVSVSREIIKKKIKANDIILEKRPGTVRPSTRVKYGEYITIIIKKSSHEDEYWQKKLLPLEPLTKIFEDDKMVVINKPPFMSVHPTGQHLFNCATVHLEQEYLKTVHSVHRLDRETSGVLVMAKNPKSAFYLTNQFETEQVKKCYLFIAERRSEFTEKNEEFWANERLSTNEKGIRRVYIKPFPEDSSEGKRARTFFKIIHKNETHVIGLAFPFTGRQHQIRVHALTHGLPLIGDKLYYDSYEQFQRFKDGLADDNDHKMMVIPRHALHAYAISIDCFGERKIFTTKFPKDFIILIEKFFNLDLNDLTQKLETTIMTQLKNFFK